MGDLFVSRTSAFLNGGPGRAAIQRHLKVLTGGRFIHLRGNDFEHCRPAQRRIQNRHDRSIRLHRVAAEDGGRIGYLRTVRECKGIFCTVETTFTDIINGIVYIYSDCIYIIEESSSGDAVYNICRLIAPKINIIFLPTGKCTANNYRMSTVIPEYGNCSFIGNISVKGGIHNDSIAMFKHDGSTA